MEIKKLGTICKLKQGFQVPLLEQETEYKEGLVRFIRIVDYTQNTEDVRYVKDNEKYYYVKPDDVVMVRYGAAGDVGHGISGVIANNMFLIEPVTDINKNYLFYYLSQKKVKHKLLSTSTSTTMPALNFKIVNELDIPIWDIDKQNELVDLFDKLSKIIADRKQELQLLDELIKARFVELFGSIYDNKFGYDVMTLQDVCEPIKDGTHQTPIYTEDTVKGYKFLSSKDVTSGKVDWNHLKYIPEDLHNELYKRISPRKGDILLAKNGTTGVAAIVDRDEIFDIYVSLALLRPLDMVTSEYLCSAVNSTETKHQFDGSLKGIGVPNLHLGEIKKTKIIVPPIEAQNQFADFVKQVDKSKLVVQKSLDEAQLLFDSLMQVYFG